MVAPVYWAIPEIANSASGEASAVNRAMPDERGSAASGCQSIIQGAAPPCPIDVRLAGARSAVIA
jgi:hypothetical protein